MAFIMQDLMPPKLSSILAPFLVALCLVCSCTDEQNRENSRLREEIITVHDRAMDKIGLMYELEIKLQTLATNDPARKKTFDQAISDLQNANKMMFDWMHQYQTLAVDSEPEKDNVYRRQQLLMIREVQRLTDESIGISETILANGQ